MVSIIFPRTLHLLEMIEILINKFKRIFILQYRNIEHFVVVCIFVNKYNIIKMQNLKYSIQNCKLNLEEIPINMPKTKNKLTI